MTDDFTKLEMRTYAIDVYAQKVRKWVTARGFTPHGLARNCGLGPGTLAKMFTPDWNPRVQTLRILEDYMMDYDERMKAARNNAPPPGPAQSDNSN